MSRSFNDLINSSTAPDGDTDSLLFADTLDHHGLEVVVAATTTETATPYGIIEPRDDANDLVAEETFSEAFVLTELLFV